jgi:hypothetical protein
MSPNADLDRSRYRALVVGIIRPENSMARRREPLCESETKWRRVRHARKMRPMHYSRIPSQYQLYNKLEEDVFELTGGLHSSSVYDHGDLLGRYP